MDKTGAKISGQYTVDLATITKDGTVLVDCKEDANNASGMDYSGSGFTQLTIAFNTTKTTQYYDPTNNSLIAAPTDAQKATAIKVEPGGIIPGQGTAGTPGNALAGFSTTLAFAGTGALTPDPAA